ncbi:MAG: 7-carboxy-7-deazaguanine synthase QueE [Pseudomonadota bacterium]
MKPDAQSDLIKQHASSELSINEIFYSLQGESTKVGLPTIFIRLSGCPLRCQYCDTAYAFHNGEKMTIDYIIQNISQYRTKHITVTGGEPLAQNSCHELLARLCDESYQVSLETSGAIDISNVDDRVMKIVDIKTPASEEEKKNKFDNLAYLNKNDQIKFVICNQADYEWAKDKINELKLSDYCEVLISPEHESQNSTDLANWILEDRLNVRMQVQLHKYLWGNVPGK